MFAQGMALCVMHIAFLANLTAPAMPDSGALRVTPACARHI
jgi:hypothetical protein